MEKVGIFWEFINSALKILYMEDADETAFTARGGYCF